MNALAPQRGRRDLVDPEDPQVTWASLGNLAAEQSLLGALMIDPRVFEHIGGQLAAEDFVSELHGDIYRALTLAIAEDKGVSPVLLIPKFRDDPRLPHDTTAGEYLCALTEGTAGLIAAGQFAWQIRELAKRRRFIDALDELKSRAASDDYGTLVEALDVPLATALEDDREARPIWSGGMLFDHTLNRVADEAAGRTPSGIKIATLPDFDEVTGGGMRRGDVTILAGRPAMGKTGTAVAVANGAAQNGHGAAFISLEMDAEALGLRFVADAVFDHGQSPSFKAIKSGNFTSDDRRQLREAADRVRSWPVTIIDPAHLNAGALVMTVRRLKRLMAAKGQQLDLVVIDYLGLVGSDRKRDSKYAEVSDVSACLKPLAKECDVAVLVLAQVNRGVEGREDKRPGLSDLRDSGNIEQDADNVVFVYREEYYLKQREPDDSDFAKHDKWVSAMQAVSNRMELYSAKVRNGETTKRLCYFFLESQAVRGRRYFEDRGLGL